MMRECSGGLAGLLARDEEAKRYFRSLPPDVRTAVRHQEIETLETLKQQAEHILRAPY